MESNYHNWYNNKPLSQIFIIWVENGSMSMIKNANNSDSIHNFCIRYKQDLDDSNGIHVIYRLIFMWKSSNVNHMEFLLIYIVSKLQGTGIIIQSNKNYCKTASTLPRWCQLLCGPKPNWDKNSHKIFVSFSWSLIESYQ